MLIVLNILTASNRKNEQTERFKPILAVMNFSQNASSRPFQGF